MGSLSWTAWKHYCRWMTILSLTLALYFGGAWYGQEMDDPAPKVNVSREAKGRIAPSEHPVVRKPLERQMPLYTVCDFEVRDKHEFDTEAYREELRKVECVGREIN